LEGPGTVGKSLVRGTEQRISKKRNQESDDHGAQPSRLIWSQRFDTASDDLDEQHSTQAIDQRRCAQSFGTQNIAQDVHGGKSHIFVLCATKNTLCAIEKPDLVRLYRCPLLGLACAAPSETVRGYPLSLVTEAS